jgi:hypothetical protein
MDPQTLAALLGTTTPDGARHFNVGSSLQSRLAGAQLQDQPQPYTPTSWSEQVYQQLQQLGQDPTVQIAGLIYKIMQSIQSGQYGPISFDFGF